MTPALSGVPSATEVEYDFLDLLLDKVNRNKKLYKVAVVQKEFDFEAPADKNETAGDGPPAGPCNPGNLIANAEVNGRLTMRDVILVRKDSKVNGQEPDRRELRATCSSSTSPVSSTSPSPRGWTAVDAVAKKGKGKKKVKKKFRFINTHFEAFDDETQIAEHPPLQALEIAGIALDPYYGASGR